MKRLSILAALVALVTTLQPRAGQGEMCDTVYDVMDFGATPDNGNADNDSTAIQLAIDTMGSNGGGIIYFPTGDYYLESPLVIEHDGITLRGAGRQAAGLHPRSSTGMTMLQIGIATSYTDYGTTDVYRCNVEELKFTGASTGKAVEILGNTANCRVENCYISGCYYGVYIHGAWNSDESIRCDAIQHTLTNLEIEAVPSGGAALRAHHCGDVFVTGLRTPNLHDDAFGMLLENGCTGFYASKCNITGGDGVLVRHNAGLSPRHDPEWLMFDQVLADTCDDFGWQFEHGHGFTLNSSWAAGCKDGPGIVIYDNASEISILGSYVMANKQDGIRVVSRSSGKEASHVRIEGCKIVSNSSNSTNTYDGISIENNVRDVIIDGNDIYNGINQQTSQKYAIDIGSSCNYYIITNNLVHSNVTGTIRNSSSGASNMTVSGNQ